MSLKKSYNIILLGDSNSGKTSFLERLSTGKFTEEYNKTTDINDVKININTSIGEFEFNVRDCPGYHKYNINKNYIDGIDAAIIMFDLTSEESFSGSEYYFKIFKENKPETPIILCGNKNDLPHIFNKHVNNFNKNIVEFNKCVYDFINIKRYNAHFDISVKLNQNLENPFLFLIGNSIELREKTSTIIPDKLSSESEIKQCDENKPRQCGVQNIQRKVKPPKKSNDDSDDKDIYTLLKVLKSLFDSNDNNDKIADKIIDVIHSMIIKSKIDSIIEMMKELKYDSSTIHYVTQQIENPSIEI